MPHERYVHGNHRKDSLKVHLIFVTRFRRALLKGCMSTDCKKCLHSICEKNGWDIIRVETDKDHVHMLIEYPPTVSISSIVQRLKRESTYYMWKSYGDILRKHYWYQDTFWSKGYFYNSIGEASTDTIIHYIEAQG